MLAAAGRKSVQDFQSLIRRRRCSGMLRQIARTLMLAVPAKTQWAWQTPTSKVRSDFRADGQCHGSGYIFLQFSLCHFYLAALNHMLDAVNPCRCRLGGTLGHGQLRSASPLREGSQELRPGRTTHPWHQRPQRLMGLAQGADVGTR